MSLFMKKCIATVLLIFLSFVLIIQMRGLRTDANQHVYRKVNQVLRGDRIRCHYGGRYTNIQVTAVCRSNKLYLFSETMGSGLFNAKSEHIEKTPFWTPTAIVTGHVLQVGTLLDKGERFLFSRVLDIILDECSKTNAVIGMHVYGDGMRIFKKAASYLNSHGVSIALFLYKDHESFAVNAWPTKYLDLFNTLDVTRDDLNMTNMYASESTPVLIETGIIYNGDDIKPKTTNSTTVAIAVKDENIYIYNSSLALKIISVDQMRIKRGKSLSRLASIQEIQYLADKLYEEDDRHTVYIFVFPESLNLALDIFKIMLDHNMDTVFQL